MIAQHWSSLTLACGLLTQDGQLVKVSIEMAHHGVIHKARVQRIDTNNHFCLEDKTTSLDVVKIVEQRP